MYKVASDRKQAALHRGRPSDWVNGQERQTSEEKLRQAKDGWKIIEARIAACSDVEERKNLIAQKREIEANLSRLKKELHIENRARQGMGDVFMQTAREILSKPQYQLIWKATLREWEKRQTELASTDSAR